MTYAAEFLQAAYDQHSIHNRAAIEKSTNCGCFSCFGTFAATAIWDWIPSEQGDTGFCPYCLMDTVIADASGLPATDSDFLRALNAKIFSGPVYWDQKVDPHPITGPGDWKPEGEDRWVLVPGYGKSNNAQNR